MRRLISLFLVGLFCLTTGSFAIAGVSSELQHDLAQTESHTPTQGEEGQGCDRCCACHYSAHLFSTANAPLPEFFAPQTREDKPARSDQVPPRPLEAFFKPPRIS